MITGDLARFMANAALKNSISGKGLKASGTVKMTCKDGVASVHCLAQQHSDGTRLLAEDHRVESNESFVRRQPVEQSQADRAPVNAIDVFVNLISGEQVNRVYAGAVIGQQVVTNPDNGH